MLYIHYNGDATNIDVHMNVVYASIAFAIVHLIGEVLFIYKESRACQTSMTHYATTCFNGRFGWVPYLNKLNEITYSDHESVETNFDFDNIYTEIFG